VPFFLVNSDQEGGFGKFDTLAVPLSAELPLWDNPVEMCPNYNKQRHITSSASTYTDRNKVRYAMFFGVFFSMK